MDNLKIDKETQEKLHALIDNVKIFSNDITMTSDLTNASL
jgi:hypothetical protein